jgi:hypothetical protein
LKHYGEVKEDVAFIVKLKACLEAIQKGETPICTVKTAMPHIQVVQRLHKEIPISNFPKERIKTDVEGNGIFVDGLYEEMYRAYESEALLNDIVIG